MVVHMLEIWLPISAMNGLYEVSDHGRVRSLDRRVGHRWGGVAVKRGKVLKPRKDKDGYLLVSLSANGVSVSAKVHRLVAEAFLPPSDLPEVNHDDLDKTNNAKGNLIWSSRKGNQEHARAAGVFSAALNPKRAKKLTLEKVAAIRKRSDAGAAYPIIAEEFGVSVPTVCRVVRRLIWA